MIHHYYTFCTYVTGFATTWHVSHAQLYLQVLFFYLCSEINSFTKMSELTTFYMLPHLQQPKRSYIPSTTSLNFIACQLSKTSSCECTEPVALVLIRIPNQIQLFSHRDWPFKVLCSKTKRQVIHMASSCLVMRSFPHFPQLLSWCILLVYEDCAHVYRNIFWM